MRIHQIELNHVRQFRKVVLDLSAPLTVIGGPQGVGKSTLQAAIFAALFLIEKKARDSLRSRFDPDSPPTATLRLSRGQDAAFTVLRRLTDDSGEWHDGATILRAKGVALKKIQESLPISPEAAALLLWGMQDRLADVLEQFPSDGHSLLSASDDLRYGSRPQTGRRGARRGL